MTLSTNVQLLIVKIVSLCFLLSISLFVTLIPIVMSRLSFLKQHVKYMRFVVRAMDFFSGLSGGVLFGGALLHLIPDAHERIYSAIRNIVVNKKGNEHAWFVGYPWAALLACFSLATIYFLEKILVKFVVYCSMIRYRKTKKDGLINSVDAAYYKFEDEEESTKATKKVIEIETREERNLKYTELTMTSLLNAIILWLSLSVHALFESLGLGSVSDMKQIWALLIAILSHKFVEAFILGRTIARGFNSNARLNKKQILAIGLFLVTFSLASPVGIGVGIGISEAGSKKSKDQFNLVSGIFLALASGAFLYVSVFEIMADGHKHDEEGEGDGHSHPEHSDHPENPIWQFISFLLFLVGLALMAILAGFHTD